MSKKSNQKPTSSLSYTGIGMALGLVLGGAIGLLTGNLVIFAGGTMVLGFAIGAALDRRSKENN